MGHEELSPAEIESLIGLSPDSASAESPSPQTETARQRHERTGHALAAALSALSGAHVDVELSEIGRQTYGELILRAEGPSEMFVIESTPQVDKLLLEIEPAILDDLLERMLGAGDNLLAAADAASSRRPPVEIATRLISKVSDAFLAALQDTWRDVFALEFSVTGRATQPRSLKLAAADQLLIVVRYELTLCGRVGRIMCCWPLDWTEQLIALAAPQRPSAPAEPSDQPPPSVEEEDENKSVDIVARLVETTMPAGELSDLRVGDVITTDKDSGEPLDVLADGQPAFRANLGKVGDRKAIQIVEKLAEDDSYT